MAANGRQAAAPDDVLPAAALARRAGTTPRLEEESEALIAMARAIAQEPAAALQRLCETAMSLTRAHAAGVSVEEVLDGAEIFRWRATAGGFLELRGGFAPRHASPCGEVVRRNEVVLMRDPARHYPEVAQLGQPVHEVLLAPFHRDELPIGTLWVVSQGPDKHFDAEDARLLQSLSTMAAAANDLLERLSFGNPSYSEA